MRGKYLITTDAWFLAPNGIKYKGAWGEVKILEDNFLGIKTNRNSTNWFAQVGDDQKGIIIAGCQIHYAVRCEEPPFSGEVNDSFYGESGIVHYVRPSEIYIAESI